MSELSVAEVGIRASRIKLGMVLLICIGFVALGLFLAFVARERIIGWISVLFFGAGIPLLVRQLLDSRPRLVISDEGILDRSLGVGVIPWTEIVGAYVRSISGNDFICLHLRDPSLFTSQFSPARRAMTSANRALGFTDLSINLSGLPVRTEEVFELIMKRCEARHAG